MVAGAWVAGDIEVEDGVLTRVGLPSTGGGSVLPGLVDLQVNGYGGVDVNAADADGARTALRALARDGVLHVQPTVITDAEDVVVRQLAMFRDLPPVAGGARVVGVHAEGPFLSPDHRGVHRPEHLRDPDRSILERFLAAGPLRTVTVAPELPGAIPFISWASRRGVIVQAGHSGADAATAYAAFDAGARAVTHLFNGMAHLQRREPGIVGAALARQDVAIQLIADDIHLARETATIALRVAEPRTMLVTDASSAAGAGDGTFTVGGFEVTVTDGVPRLPDGTLAGSTVTLLQQVGRLVEHGWPVDRAANLASRQPARFFDLPPHAGELRVGGPADLVVVDEEFAIRGVHLRGEELVP